MKRLTDKQIDNESLQFLPLHISSRAAKYKKTQSIRQPEARK